MRAIAVVLGMFVLGSIAPAGQSGTPRPAPAPGPAARAEPRRETAVPFRAGERLTYDVAWSTYLIAGTATATVVEKKPSYNSTAYYIVAEGRPLPLIQRIYALYYKMDTLLDSVTALSQRSAFYSEEGQDRRTATTQFNRPARRALFELQTENVVRAEIPVPADATDGLSTLYALRARTFKAGDRLTIPVVDNGTLYSVNIEATGPEHMRMRVGEFDAWNLRITIVDPQKQQVGKNIAVWMSTDARHLPLKIQADLPVGYFVLALKQVE
jgi:uncharacterized protein DUF3108